LVVLEAVVLHSHLWKMQPKSEELMVVEAVVLHPHLWRMQPKLVGDLAAQVMWQFHGQECLMVKQVLVKQAVAEVGFDPLLLPKTPGSAVCGALDSAALRLNLVLHDHHGPRHPFEQKVQNERGWKGAPTGSPWALWTWMLPCCSGEVRPSFLLEL
jgi:hypothetical protein